MEDTLLKDIREKIEAALPSIQVDVFRKYVDESERAKSVLASTSEELRVTKKELSDAKDELKVLRELKLKREDIIGDRQTLTIEKKMFDVEVKLKDAKIQSETEKRELVRSMFNDVFRNTSIRNSVLGSENIKTRDSCGNEYVNTYPTDNSELKTVE